jgi:hypothetical protein
MLGLLAAVCKLHASPAPTVDWISDTSSSFDVVLTGTGAGWSGMVTSPSGDWQLQSANIINCSGGSSSGPLVALDNEGSATFKGSLSPQIPTPNPSAGAPFNAATICTFGGYQDLFKPVAPISDNNSLIYGYLTELAAFGPFLNWSGMSTISITSIPNINDPSTWSWTAQYSACGQNLDAPEPNTISLLSLAALLIAFRMFRKRNERTPIEA